MALTWFIVSKKDKLGEIVTPMLHIHSIWFVFQFCNKLLLSVFNCCCFHPFCCSAVFVFFYEMSSFMTHISQVFCCLFCTQWSGKMLGIDSACGMSGMLFWIKWCFRCYIECRPCCEVVTLWWLHQNVSVIIAYKICNFSCMLLPFVKNVSVHCYPAGITW